MIFHSFLLGCLGENLVEKSRRYAYRTVLIQDDDIIREDGYATAIDRLLPADECQPCHRRRCRRVALCLHPRSLWIKGRRKMGLHDKSIASEVDLEAAGFKKRPVYSSGTFDQGEGDGTSERMPIGC